MTNQVRILAIPGNESEVFQLQVFGGINTPEEKNFKSEIEATLPSAVSIHPIKGSRIWNCTMVVGRIVTTETIETVRKLALHYGYTVISEPT